MNVNYESFQPWIKQDLGRVNEILGKETSSSSPHSFANHALLWAQKQTWYRGLESASKVAFYYFSFVMLIWVHPKSLATGPLIIGHIALARAFVGHGKLESAFEAIDAVFGICGIDENKPLLLIKVCGFLFPDLSH